jgi:hypothetical protein
MEDVLAERKLAEQGAWKGNEGLEVA